MDILTFVAALVKELAWPVVTVTAVLLLLPELRRLLLLITKLKYKDFEITFGREAEQLRDEADRLPIPRVAALQSAPRIGEAMEALIAASPRAAVLEAWRLVEQAARFAATRPGVLIAQPGTISSDRLLNHLAAFRVIDSRQVAQLHRLRDLRNEAAHAPEFALSEDAARIYVEAAVQFAEFLRVGGDQQSATLGVR